MEHDRNHQVLLQDTLSSERRNWIRKQLQLEGKVLVKQISDYFGVTRDCIRKDLKKLEEEGVLERVYGGGILVRQKVIHNSRTSARLSKNVDVKKEIATKALGLIQKNDCVFLDVSTMNILLAKMIRLETKTSCRVITNSLDVANELAEAHHVHLFMVGGEYHYDLNAFVGAHTQEEIHKFNIDTCFLGAAGIKVKDWSLSTIDDKDASTKRAVIRQSTRKVCLLEAEKLYQYSLYQFGALVEMDIIITNNSVKQAFKERLKDRSFNKIRIL